MTPKAVLEALVSGEGTTVEYKRELPPNGWDTAKELAAFANTKGGLLLVGVADDGTVVGVSDPDAVMRTVASVASSSCMPAIRPEMGRLELESSIIVWVSVPRTEDTRHLVSGKLHVRVGPSIHAISDPRELAHALRAGPLDNPLADLRSPALPRQTRAFRGRSSELARLRLARSQPRVGLIALVGISGIGKSALATEFAAQLQAAGDRPFWFECHRQATLDGFSQELSRWARAKGLEALADAIMTAEGPPAARIDRLTSVVSSQHIVPFLDDFNLVVDIALRQLIARIARDQTAPPTVITARHALPTASLVGPERVHEEHLTAGLSIDECQAFLHDCGVSATPSDVRNVWCLTGEGHPKALELFAARARRIPVPVLVESLPVFHEDLKGSWLNPLLDELGTAERDLAIALAVHERPFPIDVVRLMDTNEKILESALFDLAHRYIVDFQTGNYLQMHALVRDGCLSLLSDDGRVLAHSRAAKLMRSVITARHADGEVPLSDDVLDLMVATWDHHRQAHEQSAAFKILREIRRPLLDRGQYDRLLLLIDQTEPPTAADGVWLALDRARSLSALGKHDEAAAVAGELLDSQNKAIAREAVLVLARIYNAAGQAQRSIRLLSGRIEQLGLRAPSRARETIRTRLLTRMVESYLLLGRNEEALACARKVAASCESRGDRLGGGVALRQMSQALARLGSVLEGVDLLETSVAVLHAQGHTREEAASRAQLGELLMIEGEYARAVTEFSLAADAFERTMAVTDAAQARIRLREARAELVDG